MGFAKQTFVFAATWIVIAITAMPLQVRAANRRVEVDGERLLLGQVVAGLSPEAAALELGPAPQPGERRVVTARQLRSRLREAMMPSDAVKLPRRTVVYRPKQVLSETQVQHLAQRTLRERIPDQWRIAAVKVRGGLVVGRGTIEATLDSDLEWREGMQHVRVAVRAGESRPRILVVGVNLAAKTAGVELVRRGARVNINVRSGPVVVRSTGIAQRAGRVGEMVPVLPDNGLRIIQCRVSSRGEVELEL